MERQTFEIIDLSPGEIDLVNRLNGEVDSLKAERDRLRAALELVAELGGADVQRIAHRALEGK
jgi:hypothetical protein